MPNIVNPHTVGNLVKVYARNARHREVKQWCLHNLRNYLLRDSRLCRPCHDSLTFKRSHRVHGLKEMPEWASRLLKKGVSFDIFDPEISVDHIEFFQQIESSLDYLDHVVAARPGHSLARYAVLDTLDASRKWHDEFIRRQSENVEEKDGATRCVMDFDDGMRIVLVRTAAGLHREGVMMGHCVGSYANRLTSDKLEIYSLRDPANRPHVTIEVRGRIAEQIKGKQNRIPVKKYIPHVVAFIQRFNYDIRSDGWNLGLLRWQGRTYGDTNSLLTALESNPAAVPALCDSSDHQREILKFISKFSQDPKRDFSERLLPLLLQHSKASIEVQPVESYRMGKNIVRVKDVILSGEIWYFSNPGNGFGDLLPTIPKCLREKARQVLQELLTEIARSPLDIYRFDRDRLDWIIRAASAEPLFDEFSIRTARLKRDKWGRMISQLKSSFRDNRIAPSDAMMHFVQVAMPTYERQRLSRSAL